MAMIKTKVIRTPVPIVSPAYPCLRQNIETGAVYLMWNYTSGVCISGVDVGRFCDWWTVDKWKVFHGTVEITQE